MLLYSGALGTWYLLEEMARFFSAVRRRQPAAHWLVLTAQPPEMVRAACRAQHIPPETVTVRAVPFAEMPEWLSLADGAVLFRRPGASLAGVCPTKIGECLACGVPVAVNAGIGDCDALIAHHRVGVTVPHLSAEANDAAAGALLALSRDPALRARCREASESFALERGVARYAETYVQLVPHDE